MTTADASISFDDSQARRNSLVLAIAQGLYTCSTVNVFATAGLIGTALSPDRSLATLPVSTFVIGTVLTTVPASMLMRRVGRRAGFSLGTLFGIASALLGFYAIMHASFILLIAATTLQGGYQAFAGYYRFAAADTASESFKPKAISWVLLGGIAGGIFGPMMVIVFRESFAPVMFAGSYLASAALSGIALGVVNLVRIPNVIESAASGKARPLSKLLTQPRLLVAICCGMLTYGVMNLMMTATPIAMVSHGFSPDDSSWVIQWHVMAMFIPSFFTGHLITRYGVERIIAIGMGLLIICGIIGLSGVAFANFSIGLVLLGIGWNFGFIGATTMVTSCYRPSEKNKVQAVNDFSVFALVAVASLSSGKLLAAIGWSAVNIALFPMVALSIAALIWLYWLTRTNRPTLLEE